MQLIYRPDEEDAKTYLSLLDLKVEIILFILFGFFFLFLSSSSFLFIFLFRWLTYDRESGLRLVVDPAKIGILTPASYSDHGGQSSQTAGHQISPAAKSVRKFNGENITHTEYFCLLK